MKRFSVRTLVAVLAVVLTLLALAPPASARELEREQRGATIVVRVRIVDNRFRPRPLSIERRTVVRWVNRGARTHTTTSNRGLWNSGTLSPDETFQRRFRRAGTFRYHCNIHPSMTGTITVG